MRKGFNILGDAKRVNFELSHRIFQKMMRSSRVSALSACIVYCLFAQQPDISAERIRAHVKFLSSDLLEGRGPGTRGDQLATEYIATQFALAGLKPAGDHGSYFQQVPLIGVETEAGAQLAAMKDGRTIDFKWSDEFVGVNEQLKPEDRFEAEAIFVGHGIMAPEFQW